MYELNRKNNQHPFHGTISLYIKSLDALGIEQLEQVQKMERSDTNKSRRSYDFSRASSSLSMIGHRSKCRVKSQSRTKGQSRGRARNFMPSGRRSCAPARTTRAPHTNAGNTFLRWETCGIASYGTSWLYVVQVGYISTCNMYTPASRKAASSWCQFRVTYRLGRFRQIRIPAVWPGWHAMRYVKKCS